MPPTFHAVEAAVARVPGVATVTVEPTRTRGHGRLHLSVQSGEDARAVAKAVSDVLSERFGIDLPPDQLLPPHQDGSNGVVNDGPESGPRAGPEAVGPGGIEDVERARLPSVEELFGRRAGPVVEAADDLVVETTPDEADQPAEPAVFTANVTQADPTGRPWTATREPGNVGADTEGDPVTSTVTSADTPAATASSTAAAEELRLDDPAPARPASAPTGRTRSSDPVLQPSWPSVSDVATTERMVEVIADVTVELNGHRAFGRASGAATRTVAHLTLARAATAAAEDLFPDSRAEVETVEFSGEGDDERVTVTVTGVTRNGSCRAAAVVFVRDRATHAIAQAAVDAAVRSWL